MSIQLSISNAIKGFRPYGGGGASLLLDTYTGAAVAYSLRQLRTAYTGAAIRVRRSSDNAEQDINFVGGDLDTQSLLDFVGYNLLNYSEDATQTAWAKSRATVSGDTTTAPDGTLTGDKYVEDLTLGEHGGSRAIGNNITTPGLTYNASCYFKQAERTKIRFYSFTGGGSPYCDVDLINGTISNSTFTNTPVITAEPNGWYRVSIDVVSATTSSTSCFSFRTFDALNQISYVGDGASGVYAWGAQFTKGAGVLTYEKTGASVTKDAYITTWYDQSGNANNGTQATAASQCQIVSSGALILDVDTNKITTTWTTDFYNLTSGISTNTKYLSISMFRRGTVTSHTLSHLGNSASAIPSTLYWLGTGSAFSVRSYMPSLFSYDLISTQGRCIMTSLKDAANLKVAYRNGVQLTNTATEAPAAGTLNVFGAAGTTYTSGQYQEYIYWDSEQSANRTAIEDNIKTYWNAY